MTDELNEKPKKKKINPNMAILHCVIHKDDAELLKNTSRYHGETTQVVRNLIKIYCNKLRNKSINKDTPLEEVFHDKKVEGYKA